MKERGSECKDNNAASVKRMMPGGAWAITLQQAVDRQFDHICGLIRAVDGKNSLTSIYI